MNSLTVLDEDEEAPAGESQESAGPRSSRTDAPAAPSVSDVLGQAVPTQNPSALAAFAERTFAPVRAGLAVLLRPRVIGVLVFGLGVFILLLLGYIYLFTPLSADRAQHILLQEITASPAKTFSLAEGGIPAEGSPVAVLQIPSLHLLDAVVQGTDAQDLRSGPGHMPTTSMPGQPGNAVIAGRRATFGAPFGAIGSLKKGDVITVVDGYGTYHYSVRSVVYAKGGRHDVVTQTAGNRLTLVTAASGVFPQGRLAVIAKLIGKPLAGTTRPRLSSGRGRARPGGRSGLGTPRRPLVHRLLCPPERRRLASATLGPAGRGIRSRRPRVAARGALRLREHYRLLGRDGVRRG